MKGVLEAAGVEVPYMIDPRPNSYIEEIRDDYKDLGYSKASNTLQVQDPPQPLAYTRAFSQPASA